MKPNRAPKQWSIIEKDGSVYIAELADDWMEEPDTMLIQSNGGDDITHPRKLTDLEDIMVCLYGEYQCNDNLTDGDTFAIDGRVIAKCEGLHVLPV